MRKDARDMEPVFMGGGAAGVTAATASRILPGVVVLEGDGVGDAYIIMELGWPSPSSPNGLVDRPEGTPSSKGFVLIAVGGLFDDIFIYCYYGGVHFMVHQAFFIVVVVAPTFPPLPFRT